MKKSFSMIELIFAIIIIAISIGTLPKILEQSHEAIAKSVNQEVIWLSASKIHQILSFQWDENSMDRETNSSSFVLDVSNNGDNSLKRQLVDSENNRSRVGHIKVNGITPDERRHFHKYYTIPINQRFASAIGVETPNYYNDIDDFDSQSEIIAEESDTAIGYKAKHQIDTRVFYIKDNANYGSQNITFTLDLTSQFSQSSESTNIKLIESTIKNCVTDDTVVLIAFSSNIGLYLYSMEE